MPELTDFLLARIADDEAKARATMDARPDGRASDAAWAVTALPEPARSHVLNWGPRRVLDECEAKRRIVAGWHHLGEDDYADGMEEALRQVLCHLAAVYADHPDYDEAWRP